MQNFIAQSMRRMGLAPSNKVTPSTPAGSRSGGGQAPLAHMEVGSKWSYSSLEYPMDIQSKTDMGHYMMFYINIANDSSYSRTNSTGKDEELAGPHGGIKVPKQTTAQSRIMNSAGYSEEQQGSTPDSTGNSWKPGFKPKVIERKAHQGTASDATGIKRTSRTNDAIILYMPPSILANYAATYKDTELGANVGQAAGMASKADMSSVGGIVELIKGGAAMGAHAVERAGLGAIGAALGGDLNSARDKLSNRAQNSFLEATFTGLTFRKFSFSWKFTPKSPQEAKQVQQIIKKFKFHMLPEIKGGDHGRWFTTPAEFDLFYMFRGDENTWINKIQTCVLQNMEVNYAPNGYQTFRPIEDPNNTGAPPIEIDMKLDFMETKLITKEDVNQGF